MDRPETPLQPQDLEPPPAEQLKRRSRRRTRWILPLVALAVVLTLIAGYVILRIPGNPVSEGAVAALDTLRADSDGDGLPDHIEESGWTTQEGLEFRSDPDLVDTDGDGLTDADEAGEIIGSSLSGRVYAGVSDPTKADSDDDGLDDMAELMGWQSEDGSVCQTEPMDPDTDDDGLTDGEEAGERLTGSQSGHVYAIVSDPTSADSDDDGLGDGAELHGWTTERGAVYHTEPMNPDTDGDGLTDGDEAGVPVAGASSDALFAGLSSPLAVDTDRDDLVDADEADLGLDAYDRDTDDDGIEDGQEVNVVGSDPKLADTDGDGFIDGYEEANRDSQGLDPQVVDVRVDKWDYALDFAKGAVAGELWREDSTAWLAGNLVSGGASFIPGIGWIAGTVADVRDAAGSAIHEDWVGLGFSAVGLVPDVGDTLAVPGKVAGFVARHPELAPVVGATLVGLKSVPDHVKATASKGIWKNWDDLADTGTNNRTLFRLQTGRTNLDTLAGSLQRPTHVTGSPARFMRDGYEGERWLEGVYNAHQAGVNTQVRMPTVGCVDVCNAANIRVIDVYADGIAHESKVGYKTLSQVKKQIRSDAHLIEIGTIKGASWHFFASAHTNKLGASPAVLDLLDEVGIPYTIHVPKRG